MLAVRDAFNAAMEPLRQAKTLTKSVEAWPTITLSPELAAALGENSEALLAECLMVPKLTLETGSELAVTVEAAPGQKCMRSWFIREDVGAAPEHPTLCKAQAEIVQELIRRGAISAE